jgi:hypothetical protein
MARKKKANSPSIEGHGVSPTQSTKTCDCSSCGKPIFNWDFSNVAPTTDEFAAALGQYLTLAYRLGDDVWSGVGIIEGRYDSVSRSGHDRKSIVYTLVFSLLSSPSSTKCFHQYRKLEQAKGSDPFIVDEVHSQFCAKYLPQAVNGFINIPPLDDEERNYDELGDEVYHIHNAFSLVILKVQYSPYFARYLQSSKPQARTGKQLAGIYAKRLLHLAPVMDRKLEKGCAAITRHPADDCPHVTLGTALGFLQTVLMAVTNLDVELEDIIDWDTRQGLYKCDRRWMPILKKDGVVQGDYLRNLIPLLVIEAETRDLMLNADWLNKEVRSGNECAIPGCPTNKLLMNSEAKVCARCKTVRYVSGMAVSLPFSRP